MVNRVDRKAKFSTWKIYFPNKATACGWKKTLKAVVDTGKAKVTFRNVSKYGVELAWLFMRGWICLKPSHLCIFDCA